jgi:sec-independent protein translocase protein TatA
MGSFSIWHWLIVLALVLLLFGGGGKIPKLMGDMAKGVKAFKQGLKDGDATSDEHPAAPVTPPSVTAEAKTVNHQDVAAGR